VDPTPPLRPLPRELEGMNAWSKGIHERYVASAVPADFVERVLTVLLSYGEGWRLLLVLLLLGSLIRANRYVRFSAASCACLFGAYVPFAHPPGWVVYYVEILPVLHFMAATAFVAVLAYVARWRERRRETAGLAGWAP